MLSIDPSSPFTQGALLGDRIRLTDHFLDPGVFIRSMATRGSLGGLAEAALQAALLMDASGKDDVLLETVGVGQAEIDIVDHADTIVLALMPGSGDSVQALKAGVMEIPDVIVVNKCDHPLADTMVREIASVPCRWARRAPGRCRWSGRRPRRGRGSRSCWSGSTPIARTSRRAGRSTSGAPATCAPRCWGSPRPALRRKLEDRASSDPEWQELLDSVVSREIDPATRGRRAAGAGPSWADRSASVGRRRVGSAARALAERRAPQKPRAAPLGEPTARRVRTRAPARRSSKGRWQTGVVPRCRSRRPAIVDRARAASLDRPLTVHCEPSAPIRRRTRARRRSGRSCTRRSARDGSSLRRPRSRLPRRSSGPTHSATRFASDRVAHSVRAARPASGRVRAVTATASASRTGKLRGIGGDASRALLSSRAGARSPSAAPRRCPRRS